jgi:hypothetical protein
MDGNIKTQIESIISEVKERNAKAVVQNFFIKDVNEYLQKMNMLGENIKNDTVSQDKAYELYASYSDFLIKKMGHIENIIDKKTVLKKIKKGFRDCAKDFISKSILMHRGYDKPAGHPGDYKLIEMFYDNIPVSKGLGFYQDKYILKDSYVEAVRIRKDIMKGKLTDFIKNSKSASLNIMNLGCGSCSEIRELLSEPAFSLEKKITFTLIDWDRNALEFSKKALAKYQQNANINLKFIKANIVELYKKNVPSSQILAKQDLIYSLGVIDYIPDLILGEIVKFCFSLLNEKGILTIAHKNVKVHKSVASDWFCDWYFYLRNDEDVKMLINNNLNEYKFEIKISEDKTRHIFFLDIVKL